MENISSFEDVPIIRDVLAQSREMLSIEHVTVVANLHWEKMQSLLEALCTQLTYQGQEIQSQALRLNEQEKRNEAQDKQLNDQEKRFAEQEKRIADLQAELDSYKTALKGMEETRAKEAQQQRDLLNNALKALEDQEARTRKLENQIESLRSGLDANTQALKEIAARLSFVEQDVSVLKPLPDRVDALEANYKKLNAAIANLQQAFRAVDFAKLAKLAMMQFPQPSEPGPVPEPIVQIIEQAAPEPVIVYQPDLDLASQVDELVKNFGLLNSKVTMQGEQLQSVDSQVEQLRVLLDQLTKAYGVDIEALRKQLKALRQELDERPLLTMPPPAAPEQAPVVDSSRLEAIVAEIQHRLLRKADEESVNEVANDLQRLKDSLAEMSSTLAILRRRTSSLAFPSVDILEARMRKAEDDIATLGTTKADRSALDALELKLSLMGTGEKVVVDTSGLQGLTDLLSKKADRGELLELRMLLQALSARSHGTEIKQLFDALEELRGKLEDLRLLIRAPAPIMTTDTSDIRAELADHSRRLSELRDYLIELQGLIDKKADLTSLQFLKDMMETLKQSRKTRKSSIVLPEPVEVPDNTSILQLMWAEVTAALSDHERVLQQLTQGVLIMSGHNEGEVVTTGIVSATQPGPLLDDDHMSEASENRPVTAFSRSDAYFPTTVPAAPANIERPAEQTSPAPPADFSGVTVPENALKAQPPAESTIGDAPRTPAPSGQVDAQAVVTREVVQHAPPVALTQERAPVDVHPVPELESRLRGAERSDLSESQDVESGSGPSTVPVERLSPEPEQVVENEIKKVPERRASPRTPEVSQSRRASPRPPEVSQPRRASPRPPDVAQVAQVSQPRKGSPRPPEAPPPPRKASPRAQEAVSDVPVRSSDFVEPARSAEVVEVMQYPRPANVRQHTPPPPTRAPTPEVVESVSPTEFPMSRPPSLDGSGASPEAAEHVRALAVQARPTTSPRVISESFIWKSNFAPGETTYNALEVALKENKIQAKENVRNKDMDFLRQALEDLQSHVSSMKVVKADKRALEELWHYVRANLTDNAMLTGKPLLGFKCMSCEQSIEKLNPFRSDYLPTNMMPKQWLSMFTAERLFSHQEKREAAPSPQRAPSPPRTGAASPYPKPVTSVTPEPGAAAPGGIRDQFATLKTPGANVHLGPKVASITRK